MAQIPNISLEALDQFDHRLMDPSAQKIGEKKRKDQFKKLITGTVGVMPHVTTREQCFPCLLSIIPSDVTRHWPEIITQQ